MKTRMTQKEFEQHVAKLHLEPGDSLLIDMRMFDVEEMRFPRDVPTDVRIFPVIPERDGTLRDAFDIIHQDELAKLTREKLLMVLNMLAPIRGRIASLIDGIELDYCRCDDDAIISDKCSLHERCTILRSLIPSEEKEPIDAAI
jgi:hypothetical protein